MGFLQVTKPAGVVDSSKAQLKKEKRICSTDKRIELKAIPELDLMSVPSEVLRSNLLIPRLPEGVKAVPEAYINIKIPLKNSICESGPSFGMKKIENRPVEYSVYAQDPLVTPEVTTQKLEGETSKGPVSDRVKIIHKRSRTAAPDSDGNYIIKDDSVQLDRVNSFYYVRKPLQMYEKALGRKIPWAFKDEQLKVYPMAKKKKNARYSRWNKSIKLFYFKNKFNRRETVYTSRIADIIAHEAGHAILDGLKPGYQNWGSYGSVIHEGFGDSTSMLVAMWNDEIVDQVIKDTQGNLRKDNLISSLGEQFGKAIFGDRLYLRNANNNLKLSQFGLNKESKESHNFGQLFDGMFYDLFVSMTEKYSEKMPVREAIYKTREDLTKLFARAMADFAPPGNIYYDDIARALLQADKIDFKGKYNNIIKDIVLSRELIKQGQIEEWEQFKTVIPEIKLNRDVTGSKREVEKYIDTLKKSLNLPSENKYRLESLYTNDKGETFIHLVAPKTFQVFTANSYGGGMEYIKVYDGLTFGFDSNDKLFYKVDNKTEQHEVDDAIKDVRNAYEYTVNNALQGNDKEPGLYRDILDENLLIKAPVIEEKDFTVE